ncbi:MAG: metallophosphoesterase family protein [Dokdonella sp.]|uniref:metallophosphoesterase family protein n=1 Tax=Dokdonella sp. TaxID=2291710 RepID=UPI003267EC1B
MVRIGVISDTHGLLRPEALQFLRGCDHIVHAGDIGDPRILEALVQIAPVTAVRGNNDASPWAHAIPEVQTLQIGVVSLYVVHDIARIDIDPATSGVRVVISGHSHRPSIRDVGNVLYLNPGSAGRRRFKLPVAVAEVTVDGAAVTARVVDLFPVAE